MRPIVKAIVLCLTVLLLVGAVVSCRNRDFTPAEPPALADPAEDPESSERLQCWIRTEDGGEYPLSPARAAAVFDKVKQVYEKSDSIDPFPATEAGLRLVFCIGGTAPESVIPAYQLPNARLYGVYTLFPDDTGWYGDNLITAHVGSFKLKEGSYAALRELTEAGRETE